MIFKLFYLVLYYCSLRSTLMFPMCSALKIFHLLFLQTLMIRDNKKKKKKRAEGGVSRRDVQHRFHWLNDELS